MSERSTMISIALVTAPLLCLTALRIILPVFDSVLSNDPTSQIIAYVLALVLGIMMFIKYRVIQDHEYLRAKSIKKLSKTYKLENKGLWENSHSSLRDLEINAMTPFKGKQASKVKELMDGNIGAINKEKYENEGNTFQINDEITLKEDIISESGESSDTPQRSTLSKINTKLNQIIDRVALNKLNKKNNEDIHVKKEPNIDSKWDIITPKSISTTIECKACKSLNDGDSNYCTSCGGYIS